MEIFDSISLKSLLITLVVFIVLKIVHLLIIKPYISLQFYKSQGLTIKYKPLWGNVLDWLDDIKKRGDFLAQWKDYGQASPKPRAVALNFGPNIRLSLLDTTLIKEFLSKPDLYVRDSVVAKVLNMLIGKAFTLTDGSIWRFRRKFFSQGFHFEFLQHKVPMIIRTTDEFLSEFKSKNAKNINLKEDLQILLGCIIGKTVIGEEYGQYSLNGKPIVPFVSSLVKRVGALLMDPVYHVFGIWFVKSGLISKYRKLNADIKEFKVEFNKIVKKKFAQLQKNYPTGDFGEKELTMLELFHHQRVKNPSEALTDEEIIDQFTSFHSAGLESTAGLCTMMSYYFLQNPQYQERLLKEVQEFFKDPSAVNLSMLNKMDFLSAFVKETLRMASPVITVFPRVALEDHKIGDIMIKKGTIVNIPFAANNFSTHIHQGPSDFNPERWLAGSKSYEALKMDPFSYIPFGMGGRTCLGQHLAIIEAKVIFSMILKNFDLELSEKDYKLVFTQTLAYEPEKPMIFDLKAK